MEERAVYKGIVGMMVFKILGEGEASGYDIIKRIEEITGKRPSNGTVYPVLKEFESRGLLRGRRTGKRVLYTLTEEGRKRAEELQSLKKAYLGWLEGHARAMGKFFDLDAEGRYIETDEIHWYLMTLLSPLAREIVDLKERGVSDDAIHDVVQRALKSLKELRPPGH